MLRPDQTAALAIALGEIRRLLLDSTASVEPVEPAPAESESIVPSTPLPDERSAEIAVAPDAKPVGAIPAAPKTGPPPLDAARLPDFAIVSREQASVILGVSIDTLKRLVAAGKGPPRIKVSEKRVGYRISDLKAWLEQRPAA
jgi:predicted DNA-binding transcriptional regulator AlpA